VLGRSTLFLVLLVAADLPAADLGNRLSYLDESSNPYYVGRQTAKLVTPQWVGDEGVETAIVLAIDDLGDPAVYEAFLRPILERLKKIDGRAPVSIMTSRVDPKAPQLQAFLKEGVSLESHTFDHPCPCLKGGALGAAKATFDRAVDLVATIPNNRPVAFRMPCCDSMNSASPRFFAEVFDKTTPRGNFLGMDSSVFLAFTADDPSLPRSLVTDEEGRPRFAKYVPAEREFANMVEDYPYPYVIVPLCWEMPSALPDDWLGNNLHKPRNPLTVRDMKAAIDATAIKQGVFTLTFHPHTHNWILNSQVVELVDHAQARYGKRVKFFSLREVYQRLTNSALGGAPLRAANGQDNGVRVLDLNGDGYMDVVIGNERTRQTRLWSPKEKRWITSDFPVEIVSVDSQGNRHEAGVRFGVLQTSGCASLVVRNERVEGVWHFDGSRWVADPMGLTGLEAGGPVATCAAGRDRGVRLRDLDLDGVCELIVGNESQRAVFRWVAGGHTWQRLPFSLPGGTAMVDARGRDAGCRLVDLDEDGRLDVVYSDPQRYSVHLFVSMSEGWSRRVLSGNRGDPGQVPPLVRADGTNNGAWFKYRQLWVQNEDTGRDVLLGGQKVRIPTDRRPYKAMLASPR
jgi:hypothetical protein